MPVPVQALAAAAEVPQRGMQALLDGLVGLELLHAQDHRYSNTEEAAVFLVKTRASYLGDYVVLQKSMLDRWVSFTDIVRHGSDAFISNIENNSFWESVVRGIAPLMIPVARQAAQTLDIVSHGPCRVLDIGGGSGVYSGVWLALNPEAEVTQLDWENVNQLARKLHVRTPGL